MNLSPDPREAEQLYKVEPSGVYEVAFRHRSSQAAAVAGSARENWLKEQHIPYKVELVLDPLTLIFHAKFIFEEYRASSSTLNLKAKEQAALFRLFWG